MTMSNIAPILMQRLLTTSHMRALFQVTVMLSLGSSIARAQEANVKSLWKAGTTTAPRKASPKRDTTSARPTPRRQVTRTANGHVDRPLVDSVAVPVQPAPTVFSAPVDSLPVREDRLAALEELLRAQALELATLRLQLSQVAAAPAPAASPAPAVAAPVAAMTARVDSLRAAQQTLAKQVATAQQKLSGLGNFRFGADVRSRYEHFEQGGGFVGRERNRTRARFSLTANATEEISGGISIASGSLDDPQSPNQTSTGFFTRKTVGFDRFWVTYKPKWATPLTLTAGKFTSPWYRTSLSFGNDVTPEGIAGTWSVDFAKTSPLQNVSFVSFMLPMNEVAAGQDSYMMGGQVQARVRWTPRVTFRGYATMLGIEHPDAIAQAVAAGTIKPSSSTNTLRTDSTGKVLGYAAGFRYTDLIGAVDINVSPRLPVSLQFDWLGNSRARSDNQAWQAEAKVGRLGQLRDLQGTWTLFHIQKDAVLSAFNEQDLRAATNVVSHRVAFAYLMHPNVTLGLTSWLGHLVRPEQNKNMIPVDARKACSSTPGSCIDPTLRRLQLDISYKY